MGTKRIFFFFLIFIIVFFTFSFVVQEGVQPAAHCLLQPEAHRDQRRHVGQVSESVSQSFGAHHTLII